MNISILVFTGLVPVDSVSAGCANFCVLSEYDIGKVTGDLTGKIPQTLHVIGCLRSPVDLLKSVRDQENILVNQFHNHAQQLKLKNPCGPLDNQTWGTNGFGFCSLPFSLPSLIVQWPTGNFVHDCETGSAKDLWNKN